MLAWVVGIIYGPVSVSSQYSVETAERIELVFWHGSFLPPILHCVKRKFGDLQEVRVLSCGKNSDLENFASAYQSLKCVIDLAQQGGRSERDKLDHRQSTKLAILLSSDGQPLWFITVSSLA